LNPPQPSNHRISHLDLNQLRKKKNNNNYNNTINKATNDTSNNIRNSQIYPEVDRRLSSANESFQQEEDSILKSIINGSFQQEENSVLSSTPSENSYYKTGKENKDLEVLKSKEKKSVHNRLSRNFNRILNNFNSIGLDHDSQQKKIKNNVNNREKEEVTRNDEKEKENNKKIEKEKNNLENVPRVRKGIKLMERKIKGLSLSNLLKQNKNDEIDTNLNSSHKERNSFSVLSLTNTERQIITMDSNIDSSYHSNENNKDKDIKQSDTSATKKSTIKSNRKSKPHSSQKLKPNSSKSSLKQEKEEHSLESSRKYYETLTSILKRNKENSNKDRQDYSTFLNDIDIKVTSNSNDTINQLTEIYHYYTENNKTNVKDNILHRSSSSSSSTSNSVVSRVSSTTFGCHNGVTQEKISSCTSKKDKSMSTIKKKKVLVQKNTMTNKNISGEVVTTSLSSDGRSPQQGEFSDDNKDNMSSFYQDLNEEKNVFNNNIYNLNKYYRNRYSNNENNILEKESMKINSSADFLNNKFNINDMDDKAYAENNTSYDYIEKTHSSTDIHNYYSQSNSSKNSDNISKSIKNFKNIKEKNKDIINNNDNNKENESESKSKSENDNENENRIKNIISFYNKNSSDRMKKYTSRNTEEYENEIHDIKNFLEEQNETINADISKYFNDDADYSNISSFAPSIHSTYISSSAKEDKSLSLTSEKGQLLKEMKPQTNLEEVDILKDVKIKDKDRKADHENSRKSKSSKKNSKIGTTFSDYYNTQRLKDYYEYDSDDDDDNDNNQKTLSSKKESIIEEKKNINNGKVNNIENENEYPKTEEITEVVSEIYNNESSLEKLSSEITYSITEEKTEVVNNKLNNKNYYGSMENNNKLNINDQISNINLYKIQNEIQIQNDQTKTNALSNKDIHNNSSFIEIKKEVSIPLYNSSYNSSTTFSNTSTSSISYNSHDKHESLLNKDKSNYLSSSELANINENKILINQKKSPDENEKKINNINNINNIIKNDKTNYENMITSKGKINFDYDPFKKINPNSNSNNYSICSSIDTKNDHNNTNSNNFDNKNVNTTNPIYNSSNKIYHDNNDSHKNNNPIYNSSNKIYHDNNDSHKNNNPIYNSSNKIYHDNNNSHKNSNSNSNSNNSENDHDDIHRNYANFAKRGNNNSINYTTIDFNNPLSYISYPNYPIQLNNSNNNNGVNHHESFQNILRHFQKNCNINDKEAFADLRKQYGPSHRPNSYYFNQSNNGKGNITFNEILERFKKNCDEIEKTKVNSSSNITSSKSTPYSSSNTNLIQTNSKNISISHSAKEATMASTKI